MIQNAKVHIEDVKFITIKFQCPSCGSDIAASMYSPDVPDDLGEAIGCVRCPKCCGMMKLNGLIVPEGEA